MLWLLDKKNTKPVRNYQEIRLLGKNLWGGGPANLLESKIDEKPRLHCVYLTPNKTDVGRTDQNVWIWQNPDIINFIFILDYGRKFYAFHFWIQLIELTS